MRFGAQAARVEARRRGRRRRARARGRLRARRAEAPDRRRRTRRAPRGRRRRAARRASSCRTGSSWSRARPRCAAPTSTRSSPRCGRRAPATRRAYAQALAQRNALLARVRAGAPPRRRCAAWDLELAATASRCARPRRARSTLVAGASPRRAADLGLARRARGALPAALARRRRRGARGRARRARRRRPRARLHRPRPAPRRPRAFARRARAARLRLAGPAAAGAARAAAGRARGARRERGAVPVMLLDDVMSELDPDRRSALGASRRRARRSHDDRPRARPGAGEGRVTRLAVGDGACAGGGGGMSRRAPRPLGARPSGRSRSGSRRRRCSPPSSASGRRRRRGDRARGEPDGGARRGRHDHLLGVRVGAGARPDGPLWSSASTTRWAARRCARFVARPCQRAAGAASARRLTLKVECSCRRFHEA